MLFSTRVSSRSARRDWIGGNNGSVCGKQGADLPSPPLALNPALVYQTVMQFQEYRNAHAIDDDQQDASSHRRGGKAPLQCLLNRDQSHAVGLIHWQ